MHLLCHTHAFLEALFTACLRLRRLSSFNSSLTSTQQSQRHLIVRIENIHTFIISWAEIVHLRYLTLSTNKEITQQQQQS